MALVFYVTNYTTKAEDSVWTRVTTAAELLPAVSASRGPAKGGEDIGDNVEVIAHLLGYPTEFTNSSAWAFLNVSLLYWHVFRRWRHLRPESGTAVGDDPVDDSIVVEEAGERISYVEAYRGEVIGSLCLYDYTSLVKLRRTDKDETAASWREGIL
ncbi:hypothetical protein VCV18_012280 [Metarhizium anisopliae]|uniref:Uncharacterized protein n=1 Tax=Metarhizium rileyi (strain RCEF 4871) TaxID=1649241 RepID=A0A5C6G2M8_METRR|nr:hypothetical protein ED733_001537 [Metarhizium rileyi]